jgi:XRE family transcriptional regulator, regulator of sulfur utilization
MYWPMANGKISNYLADNVTNLRKKKGLSQQQLSQMAEIPRSTLTHIESGSGNPSLQNLAKLSAALQVGIEELLSRPRNECELRRLENILMVKKSHGRVRVYKLLPDKLKGLDVDRMEMDKGSIMGGQPHLPGAKEYLTVIRGEITVQVAGDQYTVKDGSVLAFPGDQPHSYRNTGAEEAMAISVVVPVTLGAD